MPFSTDAIPPVSDATADPLRNGESDGGKRPGHSDAESTVLPFSRPGPVSLGTLTRNGIRLDDGEAIAIGRALCLAIAEALAQPQSDAGVKVETGRPVVTAETVFIDPGSPLGVTVAEPGEEAAAIESVARILLELAPTDTLRLLRTTLAKALASPPQFATIAALAQAFAPFEQPKGRELIQAVYARWNEVQLTTALRSRTSPVPEPRPTPRIRLGSQPMAVAAAAIVVVVLFAGVAATFLMRGPTGGADGDRGAGPLPVLASRSMAWVMVARTPSRVAFERPPEFVTDPPAVDRVESSSLPPARSAVIVRTERIDESPGRTGARRRSPAVLPGVPPRIEDVSLNPPPARENSLRAPTSTARTSDGARRGAAPASRTANESLKTPTSSVPERRLPPATIYTASDADVVPPSPILPRLLASLEPSSPGIRLDALSIAVVVDEQGRAYSVNGVNAPQNMGEFVLLTSALAVVKSWEFEPALKDGVAVSYRLIVPLRAVTGGQ